MQSAPSKTVTFAPVLSPPMDIGPRDIQDAPYRHPTKAIVVLAAHVQNVNLTPRAIYRGQNMAGNLVRDYMVPKREKVAPKDAVITAIELMVERDVGSVLVVDDQDRAVGIFTERDLLRHYLEGQSRFLYLTVEEVMSSPVVSIHADATLAEAIDMMAKKDIRHLPVVDRHERCVGFLTWRNLFHQFAKMVEQGADQHGY